MDREPTIRATRSPSNPDTIMTATFPEHWGVPATEAMVSMIVKEFARRFVDENYEKISGMLDMEAIAKQAGAAILTKVADRITIVVK